MSVKSQLRRLLHLLPAVERCHKTHSKLCGVQVVGNWVGLTDGHRLARVEIPLHLWPADATRPARYQLPLKNLRSATKTEATAFAYLDPIHAVDETIPDLNVPAMSPQAVTGRSQQWVTSIGLVGQLEHVIHARAMAHKQALDAWRQKHAEFIAKNRAAVLAANEEWKAVLRPPKGDKTAAASYQAQKAQWRAKKRDLAAARRAAIQKHRDEEPQLRYDVALTPKGAMLHIISPERVLEAAGLLYAASYAEPDMHARSVNVDARYLRDALLGMAGADSRTVITLSTEDVMMVIKVEPLNAATEGYALIMPMRA